MSSKTQKLKMPETEEGIEELRQIIETALKSKKTIKNIKNNEDDGMTEREREKAILMGYDTHLDFEKNEKFDEDKLIDYFKEDIDTLDPETYVEYFHLSKSFKYFNHFFYFYGASNKYYRNDIDGIKPYVKLMSSFNNLHYKDKKLNFKFTKLYDESNFKNKIDGFEFAPDGIIDKNKINLFSGFKFDSDDKSYDIEFIQPFLDHIKFICNVEGNTSYNYLVNWFSHILQFPWKKTNCALVLFSSAEGVGKNLISDTFCKIINGYEARIDNADDLTERFNSHLMSKLFIVCDEVSAKAKKVSDELKGIITRKTTNYEFKGADKILLRDCANYFMTTNNENNIKTSHTDRHYFFINCPEEIKEKSYYTNLYKLIGNDNFIKQLFNYFITLNIDGFNPSRPPMTEYKESLIVESFPGYIKFITEEYDKYADEKHSVSDLYDNCVKYCIFNHISKNDFTKLSFCHRFKKVFEDFQMPIKKDGKSYYFFPSDKKDQIIEIVKSKFIIKRK